MESLRSQLRELVALGPFPESVEATGGDDRFEAYYQAYSKVEGFILTDHEVVELLKIFPISAGDDFYAMAYGFINLIQQSSAWPKGIINMIDENTDNVWHIIILDLAKTS